MSGEPELPTLAQRLASAEVIAKFGDDPESAQLCLELFCACKAEYAELIRSGITARDPETLQRVGHTLAGSFMGILRPRLLTHARELEDEARARVRSEGSLDSAIQLGKQLLSVLDGIDQEVREHLKSGGTVLAANEARQVT